MANPWLPAFLLMSLSMASTVQAEPEDDWTPTLTTGLVDDGVKLAWTTPEGPRGRNIDHTEVWRYSPAAPGLPGTWDLYETRNGVAPYFVDEEGRGETFYFVRLVFTDGETSPPSNPSSVDYPHCTWLILTVPPHVTSYCLFPPPFVPEI